MKQKIQTSLIILIVLAGLSVVNGVFAAQCTLPNVCTPFGETCSTNWRPITDTCQAGGLCCAPPSSQSSKPCLEGQICNPLAYDNVEGLINAIIGFLIKIGIPIATIMFVIAGIVFVTSAGDPGKTRTARSIMIYTAVGLAVILAASGLIKVLQSLLGDS